MTAKGGANRIYSIDQIVSLAIPPKIRLSAEATRLPYRVLKITKGAYTLLSLYGQLKGLHQESSLKAIPTNEDFSIPMEANPSKKPITLSTAITLSNNRKSILAQQKIGAEANKNRKRKRTNAEKEALAAQEAEAVAL
jgi:hypothetical protein